MDEKTGIKIRNVILLNELDKIDRILDRENIEAGVIKGCSMILNNIYDIDEREMSDVDLIVKKDDYEKVIGILYDIGYKKIEKGRNSFYKEIGKKFAPIIFDIHYEFLGIKYLDIDFKYCGYKKIKSASPSDELMITASHSIVKHSFFGDRERKDFLRIYQKGIFNKNFIKDVFRKAKTKKLSYIIWLCFKKCNIFTEFPDVSLKEILSIPFVNICFYKHFKINEYILPFFYDIELVKNKFYNGFLV